MTVRSASLLFMVPLAACGGGGTQPNPPDEANCAAPRIVNLTPGDHLVIDPAVSAGCVRVGGAAADEEYHLVLYSGAGTETENGVSGAFGLRIAPEGILPAPGSAPASPGWVAPYPAGSLPLTAAERFDASLRQRESRLVVQPEDRQAAGAAPVAIQPVTVGEARTFKICATDQCTSFADVPSTARAVGDKVAIFSDDANPAFAESFLPEDYAELADMFDRHLHPIGTSAFGAESDIDANGRVIILISKRVNDFTPDCAQGRIIGYFYGGDLLTTVTGSNRAEIFFTFAPVPATATCSAVTRRIALNQLKPTLIHEFQHMISFNQHRLIRGGAQEQTWLNEGLSHLAQDLAGQLIPNADCPGASSCRGLFNTGDLSNIYSYWNDTQRSALVYGRNSSGTLPERGIGFLFTRWLLDRYGSGENGFDFTRALLATTRVGQDNVQAVTGGSLPALIGEMQLTGYLDGLPGFTPLSTRLTYTTWDFRTVMNNPANSQLFPAGYSLKPPVVIDNAVRGGVLRAGTGIHLLLRPAGSARDLLVTAGSSSAAQPDKALVVRLALARIR